jgi:hypothetical protein
MAELDNNPEEYTKRPSCDSTMSRQEFIEKVIKRAALIGIVIAAPKIIDRFLVPPAFATLMSTLCTSDTLASKDCTGGGCADTHAGAACRP